jgi:hypothetical protein
MLLSLGLFAVVGLLGYFVFYGPGELSISKSDGQFTIRTGQASRGDTSLGDRDRFPTAPARRAAPTDDAFRQALDTGFRAEADAGAWASADRSDAMPPADPVQTASQYIEEPMPIDSFPSSAVGETTSTPALTSQAGDGETETSPPRENAPSVAAQSNETDRSDQVNAPEVPGSGDKSGVLGVEAPVESGPTEMSDEMVAAADAKIDAIEEMIRNSDWERMKPAAESLLESLMTDAQREQAETLYQLVDLATYYRGAIRRGIAGRQGAESIPVTEALRIGIVSVEPDQLTIRYAGKNKSYAFDELPMILAHALAEFALPQDQATNLAAKACYQAMAPNSHDEYRQEAIDWLISTDGDVAGADPKKIADLIHHLYDESN